MSITGLEAALLGGMFVVAGAIMGVSLNHFLNLNKCDMCGISELRMDIRVQSFIIRRLAEKQGLTQAELIEIEAMAQVPNHWKGQTA